MKKLITTAVVGIVIVSAMAAPAEAGPFGWRGRRQQAPANAVLGGPPRTAQAVADLMARIGRVGHFGGWNGPEGCGMGSTRAAALANCCYARSGMNVADRGVARSSSGMYFACQRYGGKPQ